MKLEPETYISSDDSQLLRDASKGYSGNFCLEIGVGYGSNLKELVGNFTMTVGTDIQKTSAFGQNENLQLVLADCASCFRPKVFDLILLNPPYLPSSQIRDRSVDGGKGGFEIAKRFLKDAIRVTKKNGTILVVLSSETSNSDLEAFRNEEHFEMKVVRQKQLFYEEIIVYEICVTDR